MKEQNYYITDSTISNGKNIYFEGAWIGLITPSKNGFVVQPTGAKYKGVFKTLEDACIELVFHYYGQTRQLQMC